MGGFEGGDEGGYWDDEEPVIFSKAKSSKPNIEKKGSEYILGSVSLVPCVCDNFTVEAHNETLSKTLNAAYGALLDYTDDSEIEEFFQEYKVVIKEESSTNAEVFLHLTKEACNLILRDDEIEELLALLP
ncbi:MAG: hypothetical protein U9Q40_10940 [Campylobacterota bacterium]|nr:hypothetical protein [Campylobacterota bacterium]